MKINIKIVFLSILIALLMYPKTIDLLIKSGKNAYIAGKLSTVNEQGNTTSIGLDKTRIVFIFDDGWESVYTDAYEILNKYGYKASVSVIPANVGEKECMSYEQLSELFLHGWDLLNHSYSHLETGFDNPEGLLSEFSKARRWMQDRQIGNCGDMAIIPYGEINPYMIMRMKEEKFRNIRTSDNIIVLNKYEIEYYPVNTINLLTEVTVKEVINLVTQPRNEFNTIIFILHKIEEGNDEYGMKFSKEKLEQILKFIDEHEDEYQVITYSQLFE